ncbi:TolC family protein [Pseudochelatococcus contaminans]|uniref:Outer membrane protein TolC n=1 Tax=Pseudochelatococcus contaminans TaxID=1538103 RepID=A0A7W5Z343_9HYPH|nr:TolC family protein [Pseudochelatococcus contaminans]MBB3809261.1 outer membrane protein TolC [Pseudochelatococcus contaminans]
MKPEPFSLEDNLERAAKDRAALEVHSPPPTKPITLEEAQARALVYNLDHRLRLFNATLQDRQLDLTRMDLLPSLTANAGYVSRDKDLVSSSASYQTGQVVQSNFETTSTDRQRTFGDLTLSWNVIDFGVSYLQAKQQADRVIIAEEQRRRVVNNIFQQVHGAYWGAVSAEKVVPRIKPVIAEARKALAQSRAAGDERLQNPAEALQYQRDLLELIQQLESVEDQLSVAKTELAQLMGLRPGTNYRLAPPPRETARRLKLSIDQMEQIALVNRPELREEAYNARIVLNEGRRAILQLVPGVTMLASINYDSNSYLLYNDWREAGLRLAANIVRLASMPSVIKLGKAQNEIAESRRLAMAMSVIAQVQIATRQYAIAYSTYERSRELEIINRKIAALKVSEQEADSASQFDLIREKANALFSELRSNRTLADLQRADANIRATLGVDPLAPNTNISSLQELSDVIASRHQAWRKGDVTVPTLPAVPAVPAETPQETADAVQAAVRSVVVGDAR